MYMSEWLTMGIVLFIAALCGTIITVILSNRKKFASRVQIIASWIINCYFEFWILNCFRVVLLKGNTILSYSENIFLLFFDLIFMILGMYVIFYFHGDKISKGRQAENVSLLIMTVCYIALFVINYIQYHNINAAIYSILLPSKNFSIGMIVFVVYLILTYGCKVSLLWQRGSKAEVEVKYAVISLFTISIFVYPVLETYLTNSEEFSFSPGQVWYWYILFIVFVFVGVSIFCTLLKGKLKDIFLFMMWSLSICAYIQGMFLNNKLFLMDGKEAEWSIEVKITNLIMWCILLGVLLCLYRIMKNSQKSILIYSSVALCVMQLVGGISLLPNFMSHENKGMVTNNYLSTEGLYEAAKEDNILIFVLDTYDVDFIEEVLEQKPDFLDPLKGFTYFPDTVSQFSRTFPSVPYMLTEELYFYEQSLNEYVDSAFEGCSFWKQMNEKGYQLYFYEEDENYIGESVKQMTANYTEQGHVIKEKISFTGCVEAIVRINNYRLFPYSLKEYYTYTSGMISDLVVKERVLDLPMFVADDVEVYKQFRKNGLQISEEEKALRFIHLNGAHAPYVMTENGARVNNGAGNDIEQYIGSMNLVYDYLKSLKELGLYEKSTIIITADHGENYVTTQLEENTNPILFIKPAGVGMDKEMQISDVYASQNDILPTLSEIYGIKYNKEWGLNLLSTQEKDKSRTRYHYYAVVENGLQTKTRTYKIEGSSLDFCNWHATEEYHEFGKYY